MRGRPLWIAAGMGLLALIGFGILHVVFIGGTRVDSTTVYPFALDLSLTTSNGLAHRCNAALIGPELALTAAHCVDLLMRDIQGQRVVATGNTLTLGSASGGAIVVGCRCEPRYAVDGGPYDVGLLRVQGSTGGTPAAVGDAADDASVAANKSATAVGFSHYLGSQEYFLAQLLFSNVAACSTRPTEFCAGDFWHFVEQGDSGAPLWSPQHRVVVAVESDREGMVTSRFVRVGLGEIPGWQAQAANELAMKKEPLCSCR